MRLITFRLACCAIPASFHVGSPLAHWPSSSVVCLGTMTEVPSYSPRCLIAMSTINREKKVKVKHQSNLAAKVGGWECATCAPITQHPLYQRSREKTSHTLNPREVLIDDSIHH